MNDWLKQYFALPLRLLALMVEFFRANRRRVRAFMARPIPALITRALVILTAIAWLLVAVFGDGRQGERLDQWWRELRQTAGFESG